MRPFIRSASLRLLFLSLVLFFSHPAAASETSPADTAAGIKEALTRGAEIAVAQLGKKDGFLGNSSVRIPLPDSLRSVEKAMRTFGMKKQADELIETMNRAAESAVVEAKPILVGAVKKMSVDDARGILTGGDNAATQYFRRTTSDEIAARFLPIVGKHTSRLGLARQYDKFAGQAAKLGLLDEKDADLDAYVTHKAMDGLFLMIAEQEKAIRDNPVAAGSKLLQKVFGSLGR